MQTATIIRVLDVVCVFAPFRPSVRYDYLVLFRPSSAHFGSYHRENELSFRLYHERETEALGTTGVIITLVCNEHGGLALTLKDFPCVVSNQKDFFYELRIIYNGSF